MILTGLDVDEMMNKIEIASDIIFTMILQSVTN